MQEHFQDHSIILRIIRDYEASLTPSSKHNLVLSVHSLTISGLNLDRTLIINLFISKLVSDLLCASWIRFTIIKKKLLKLMPILLVVR